MNLVAGFEFRAPGRPVYLLAHAVPDDPRSALARLLAGVPAVVEEPVFAGDAVVQDVRVLPRHRPVDVRLTFEGQIVAPEKSFGTVHIDHPSDVDSRLVQPK